MSLHPNKVGRILFTTHRTFPLQTLALLAALAGIAAPAAARSVEETPCRALWVVRDALLNPESIEEMVADAAAGGITDLIVQVRGRADAYYRSDLVPAAIPLRDAWRRFGDYDPLGMTLDLAHARGIRVHAWMNVYLAASAADRPAGHVVDVHPEWVATDARGVSMLEMDQSDFEPALTEGQYLDPGNGQVARHFAAVVQELVERYPVDGVHLDYVRYPHMDVGYNEAMRSGFRRLTGIDPLELALNREGLRRERGPEGLRELQREWEAFRAAQITGLVRQVRFTMRAVRPGLFLSAAVKPDVDGALSRYGQDWTRWIHEDLIDVAAPMMYSKSTKTVRGQVDRSARLVPPERVWAGIAVYNQSLASAEEKIREARRAGLGGVSIYSWNSLPGGGRSLARLGR